MAEWFVYIIEASDGSYYTGVTTDTERRFQQHCHTKRGAKYFNGRAPLRVVFVESGHNRSSACKREAQIKSLRREKKQILIDAYEKSRTALEEQQA